VGRVRRKGEGKGGGIMEHDFVGAFHEIPKRVHSFHEGRGEGGRKERKGIRFADLAQRGAT
jgi:hypothetical protein